MKQRFFTTSVLLLSILIHIAAQALTDRYDKTRPVVVACESDRYVDVTKFVINELELPCVFKFMNIEEAKMALKQGEADLIIADSRDCSDNNFIVTKSIIDYYRIEADSIAELRYVGKDRQLVEQMDFHFIRLKQKGDIAEYEERWEFHDLTENQSVPLVLNIADTLLLISIVLLFFCLLVLWNIRTLRRHTIEVSEMLNQARQMSQYYAIEDNQAAHDLTHKYEAILANPFVAFAFYDNKGNIIVENEAMTKLGRKDLEDLRQPLYSADGEIINYFVAIKV